MALGAAIDVIKSALLPEASPTSLVTTSKIGDQFVCVVCGSISKARCSVTHNWVCTLQCKEKSLESSIVTVHTTTPFVHFREKSEGGNELFRLHVIESAVPQFLAGGNVIAILLLSDDSQRGMANEDISALTAAIRGHESTIIHGREGLPGNNHFAIDGPRDVSSCSPNEEIVFHLREQTNATKSFKQCVFRIHVRSQTPDTEDLPPNHRVYIVAYEPAAPTFHKALNVLATQCVIRFKLNILMPILQRRAILTNTNENTSSGTSWRLRVESHLFTPTTNEVIIRPLCVGICGGDMHRLEGYEAVEGMVMGHEMVGIVASQWPLDSTLIHQNEENGIMRSTEPLYPGDRVVLFPMYSTSTSFSDAISHSSQSPSSNSNNKPETQIIGIHLPGALSQWFSCPRSCVVRIPSSLPTPLAVLVEPFAVGVHAMDTLLRVSPSPRHLPRHVTVVGSGSVGVMMTIALIHHFSHLHPLDPLGCGTGDCPRITVVAKHPHQVAAIRFISSSMRWPDELLSIVSLRSAAAESPSPPTSDCVIEAVGTSQSLSTAVGLVKDEGTVILLGIQQPTKAEGSGPMLASTLNEIVFRQVKLVGTSCYTRTAFERAISALDEMEEGTKEVLTKYIVTHQFPLSSINDAFETHRSSAQRLKVVITPNKETKS